MRDVHRIYSFLEKDELLKSGVRVVALFSAKYAEGPVPNLILMFFDYFVLPLRIWIAATTGRLVVLREFSNLLLLTVCLLLWPLRRRVLCNINHNLSYSDSSFQAYALRCLLKMGFRFMLFDGSCHTLPRWIPEVHWKRFQFPTMYLVRRGVNRSQISVVGTLLSGRREKISSALPGVIISVARAMGLNLIFGVRGTPPDDLPDFVSRVDVGNDEDYAKYFESISVFVMYADPARYAFRHSGVLYDAIRAGCIVVVPDLPMFKAQIDRHNALGYYYSTVDGLSEVLVQAFGSRIRGEGVVDIERDWHLNWLQEVSE